MDYSHKMSLVKSVIIFCLCCMAAELMSCSFSVRDRWEGLWENKLRVCAQIYMPDYAGDVITNKNIVNELLMAGKKRAWVLINSHVQNRGGSVENLQNLKIKLDTLLISGSIIYSSCSEENCMAFIDFTLSKSVWDEINK